MKKYHTELASLLFLISFFYYSNTVAQSPRLWGMTGKGGGPTVNSGLNLGTLFSVNGDGTDFYKSHDFCTLVPGKAPQYGHLLKAYDGKLYGLTSRGGLYENGVLFSYDPVSNIYIDLFDFDSLRGGQPFGSLIQATDGKLYGMTSQGGSYGCGVIFSYDLAFNVYLDIHDFNGAQGAYPFGSLLQATNGKIYGMTWGGGGSTGGIIFCLLPNSSSFFEIFDFYGSGFYYPKGRFPYGSLIQAKNGKLYGMTSSGGASGGGTIFSLDTGTNIQTVLYSFASGDPTGDLTELNGKLYGIGHDYNTIFSFKIDSNIYKDIYYLNITTGSQTYGSFVYGGDGKLYSLTKDAMFSYDTLTGTCTNYIYFTGTNGSQALGSLAMADNGKFYGMTLSGGWGYGQGILFSYDTSTHTFEHIYDFNQSDGQEPGDRLLIASDGKYYGLTSAGGIYNNGTIFSFNHVTGAYTKLFDMVDSTGKNPYGGFIQASDGKLYGAAYNGGTNGYGVIFSYDPLTGIYADRYNFRGGGSYSQNPVGRLLEVDSGLLYGLTDMFGGITQSALYRFDLRTNLFSDVAGITGLSGSINGIIRKNETLFGVCGGTGGTLFAYNLLNQGSYEFYYCLNNYSTGIYPSGELTLATNGKLYGTADGGGAYNDGVIYSVDSPYLVNVVYNFNNTNGSHPVASLMEATDGYLYGTTFFSTNTLGNIFRYKPDSNIFNVVYEFNLPSGYQPRGSLIQGGCTAIDTNLYINICSGSIYNFNGRPLSSSGIYIDTFIKADGCDSLVILHLKATNLLTTARQASIYCGNTYVFGSRLLSGGGVYLDTLTAQGGCDSVILLQLHFDSTVTTNTQDSICQGAVYTFGGQLVSSAGIYKDTLASHGGCDSVIILNLFVDTLPSPTISRTNDTLQTQSFTQYQWLLNGNIINGATAQNLKIIQNGSYRVIVTGANGCENRSSTLNVTGIGITEITNSYGIKLYPNPNFGTFTLEFTDDVVREVEITDVVGSIVMSPIKFEKQTRLTLDQRSSGIYFLHITQNGQMKCLKFTVMK